MSKIKEILLLRTKGFSQRKIADTLKVSRNTVAKVVTASESIPLPLDSLEKLSPQEIQNLLFPDESKMPTLKIPDYDYVHKELMKTGVTLKLLWEDYVADCRSSREPPYMYSQFCKLYQEYVQRHRLTMHIKHKPGDKLMVDWMGTTLPLYDKLTGNVMKAYLFVGTLPFSMYVYAKACLSQKEEDWINVHVDMFEYFDGSTRLLIPDNLRTGILSNKKYEDPIFNQSYQELADHYQSALLPARISTPKDKAAVEGSVKQLTTYVVGRLRNQKFFTLATLNNAIRKELDRFNHNEFQKRDGSRYSVFIEEELPFMHPLPQFAYEYAKWKAAMVQLNYHIAVDYQNYSVPYEYVKKRVDVRCTQNIISVFYKGSRICSHKRLYGRRGQYSTIVDHMPPNHQLYSEWNADRFLKWAGDIGLSTREVVEKIFSSYRVEEQAYKGCLALLKLADKYPAERLENACKLALSHIPNPRYKNIRLILEAGQDKKIDTSSASLPSESNQYAYVRGAAYYGGEKK